MALRVNPAARQCCFYDFGKPLCEWTLLVPPVVPGRLLWEKKEPLVSKYAELKIGHFTQQSSLSKHAGAESCTLIKRPEMGGHFCLHDPPARQGGAPALHAAAGSLQACGRE